MKSKYLWLLVLLLGTISGFGQSPEELYLQQESTRISNAVTTEQQIETYISQNLNSYKLTEEKLNEVTYPVIEDVRETLTGKDLEEAILYAKRVELRKLYFQQNPLKKDLYIAALAPMNVTPCINANFVNGTQGFSFSSQRFTNNWVQYSNIPTAPVLPTTGGIIELVGAGIDQNTINQPVANQLSQIFPTNPTVPGARAIRLNNRNGGNYDVSALRRNFVVNTPTISFNFALVLQNGHQNAPATQSYFQYRLLNNGVPVNSPNYVLAENRIVCNINDPRFRAGVGTGANQAIYTDWSCEVINTAQFQNMNVTLEIIVADCGASGHYGYAYLDNFCGMNACTTSTFGDISLNPLNAVCPSFPVNVTGTFNTPPGNTLSGIVLQVRNAAGTVVGTLTSPTIVGNNFTFQLNQANFGTPLSGNYELTAVATFTVNGVNYIRNAIGANNGPDISFNNCITGNITLNPVNENCPLFPLIVTGTFNVQSGATMSNFALQVRNSLGTVISTLTNPTITGNTFSFTVNESNFGTAPLTGNFEFRVQALASLGGSSITLVDLSANDGPDVSFSDCSLCCANCCVDNQSLASPVLANYVDTRQANMRILAVNTIHNGAFASYHAGDFVLLKPGFNAVTGSRVHIYNEGCTGTYILRGQNEEPSKEIIEPETPKATTASIAEKVELVRIENQDFISILPNPNNGIFKIKLSNIDKGTIEVSDLFGIPVFKKSFEKQDEFEVDIQSKPKGIYIVRVISDNRIITEKIIKK